MTFPATCHPVLGWQVTSNPCNQCTAPPFVGGNCSVTLDKASCGCLLGTQPNVTGAITATCNTVTGFGPYSGACIPCSSPTLTGATCSPTIFETSGGFSRPVRGSCQCSAGYFGPVAFETVCENVGWQPLNPLEGCTPCSNATFNVPGASCTLQAGGYSATCQCNSGYYLSSDTANPISVSCSVSSGWGITSAGGNRCTPCGNVTKAVFPRSRCTVTATTTAACSCDAGFHSGGAPLVTATCLPSSGWYVAPAAAPTCYPCDLTNFEGNSTLYDPATMMYNITGVNPSFATAYAEISLQCKPGFMSGAGKLHCDPISGEWTGDILSCLPPTRTPTATPTRTQSRTVTPTVTASYTASVTPSSSTSASASASVSMSVTPTVSPVSPTPTPQVMDLTYDGPASRPSNTAINTTLGIVTVRTSYTPLNITWSLAFVGSNAGGKQLVRLEALNATAAAVVLIAALDTPVACAPDALLLAVVQSCDMYTHIGLCDTAPVILTVAKPALPPVCVSSAGYVLPVVVTRRTPAPPPPDSPLVDPFPLTVDGIASDPNAGNACGISGLSFAFPASAGGIALDGGASTSGLFYMDPSGSVTLNSDLATVGAGNYTATVRVTEAGPLGLTADCNMVMVVTCDPSALGLAAACAPPSTTPSTTPSPSRTGTVSASPSLTPSPSATSSETPSVSASRTVTATHTGTGTPSASASATPAATSSATPTASASVSGTASQSSSPSATTAGSPSATPSMTGSATQSASLTPSASVSRSVGSSASVSGSPSVSPTSSTSLSASVTLTPSVTASMTATPTGSSSGTASTSVTPSGSTTSTSSTSATASISLAGTPSLSSSASVTPTVSATGTKTASPTRSSTRSGSQTPSQSVPLVSLDPSTSATPTASPTITSTRTRSTTKTSSFTATVTVSVTTTGSATTSATGTPSVTMTSGGSVSSSPTRTASASGSPTATGSSSHTPSNSRMPSPSPTGSVVISAAPSASATPQMAAPSPLSVPSLGPFTSSDTNGIRVRIPARVVPRVPGWLASYGGGAGSSVPQRMVAGPALPAAPFDVELQVPPAVAAWTAGISGATTSCSLTWAVDVPEPAVAVTLPTASLAPPARNPNTTVTLNGAEVAGYTFTLHGSVLPLATPLLLSAAGVTIGRLDCWVDMVMSPAVAPWDPAAPLSKRDPTDAVAVSAARTGLVAAMEAAVAPGGSIAAAAATAGAQVLWVPSGAAGAPHWVDALVEAPEPVSGLITLRSAWSSSALPLTGAQGTCWVRGSCFTRNATTNASAPAAATAPAFLKAVTRSLVEPSARSSSSPVEAFPFLLPLSDRANVTMIAAVPAAWTESLPPAARSLFAARGLAAPVADAPLPALSLRLAWTVAVNGIACPVSWVQLFTTPGSSSLWVAVRFETPARADLARLDAWMHGFDDRLAGLTPPSPPSTLGELPVAVSIDRTWIDTATNAPLSASPLQALWYAASPAAFWGSLLASLKGAQAATAAAFSGSPTAGTLFTDALPLPFVGTLCPYDCPAEFGTTAGSISVATTCVQRPEDGTGVARLRRLPLPASSSPVGKALQALKDSLAARTRRQPVTTYSLDGAAASTLAGVSAAVGALFADASCPALSALPFPRDVFTGEPRVLQGGAGAASGLDLEPVSAVLRSSDSVAMRGAVYLKPCAEVPPVDSAARDATGTALLVGGYTDPTRGACLNSSSPAARGCPYQSREGACAPCPAGSMCLGRRAFALDGYWSPSAVESQPLECPEPAMLRCTGYQPGAMASGCGSGYLAASSACAACDFGYFPDASGACISCPPVSGGVSWSLLRPLVVMAAGAIAVGLLIFGVVFMAMRRRGGTVKGGLQRSAQFVAASLLIIQTVAQALGSVRSAPSLPPVLKTLVSFVDWLTLDEVSVHPNCATSTPFLTNYLLFSFALALSGGALLLAAVDSFLLGPLLPLDTSAAAAGAGAADTGVNMGSRAQGLVKQGSVGGMTPSARSVLKKTGSEREAAAEGEEKEDKPGAAPPGAASADAPAKRRPGPKPALCARFGRTLRLRGAFIAFALLSILYGAYTGSAFRILRCEDVHMTVASYLVLNQDGSTLVKAGLCSAAGCKPALASELARVVTVTVLSSLPSQVCWEGNHRPVAMLAVAVLAFTSVFVPLVTLPWVWRRLSSSSRLVGVYYAIVRNRGGDDRGGDAASSKALADGTGGSGSNLTGGGGSGRSLKQTKRALSSGRGKGLLSSAEAPAEPKKKRTVVEGLAMVMGCAPLRADAVASARLAGCVRVKRFSPLDDSAAPPVAMVLGADRLTSFFTRSEFWPSRFFSKHVDYATILVLSALSNLGEQLVPADGRLAGSIAIVAVAAVLLVSTRPYRAEVRFNFPVKLGCYLVTILAALCSYYVSKKDTDKVAVLAWMLLISGAALLLTLLYYFWVVLLRGAVQEEATVAATKEAVERIDTAESATLRALMLGGGKEGGAGPQRLPPALMAAALAAAADSGGQVAPPLKSLLAAEKAGLKLGVPTNSFAPAPLTAGANIANPVFGSNRAVPPSGAAPAPAAGTGAKSPSVVASTPSAPNRASATVMLSNPIEQVAPPAPAPAPAAPRRQLMDTAADDATDEGSGRTARAVMSSRIIMTQDVTKSFLGVQQTIRTTKKGGVAAGSGAQLNRASSRFLSGTFAAAQGGVRGSVGGVTFEPLGTVGSGGTKPAGMPSNLSSRLSMRGATMSRRLSNNTVAQLNAALAEVPPLSPDAPAAAAAPQ